MRSHGPTHDGTPVEESWATMIELVEEGKVRFVGASNFDVGLLERCQAIRQLGTGPVKPPVVVQAPLEPVLSAETVGG